MLDLNFVRDNLPLVEEKLRQRGMDPAAGAEGFPSGGHAAPPRHHRSRDHESPAQPRLRRHCQAEEERPGCQRADCGNQGIAGTNPAAGESGGGVRGQSAEHSHRHPQSAPRQRAGWQNARRQCRGPALGHAAQFDFTPKPHWELGEAAGRARSRTRHQTFRARASRCTGTWERGWSGRWPISCSTCTLASTATPKCCRLTW